LKPSIPFLWIGQAATAYYFAHILIIIPIVGVIEKPNALPESISAAVKANVALAKPAE
jgi:hypothetical protein